MNLRVVHLLSQPEDERERRSFEQVFQLAKHGADYHTMVNPVYAGELPPAREANDRPFELTKAHYGCWKAHKDAIDKHLGDDIDALLICECDTVFVEPVDQMFKRIERAYEACVEHDLLAFNFGYKHNADTVKLLDRRTDTMRINQWIESHCYLLRPKSKPVFTAMFERPWDTYDYCLTVYLLDQQQEWIGAFADRPLAVQADGMSLLDGKVKTSEDHYRNLRYDA